MDDWNYKPLYKWKVLTTKLGVLSSMYLSKSHSTDIEGFMLSSFTNASTMSNYQPLHPIFSVTIMLFEFSREQTSSLEIRFSHIIIVLETKKNHVFFSSINLQKIKVLPL
ncbi:hypothetical protein SLE2022_314790 [Rubroshorea leprosula]